MKVRHRRNIQNRN